jgi:PPP family 3-phenylpropionic acid transporter
MLGGLLSGWSWDAAGPELTFSMSAAFALVGMLILWRGWRADRP